MENAPYKPPSASVLMPLQASLSILQMMLYNAAVCSLVRLFLALQATADSIQLHNSELGVGGRVLEADQSGPNVGQFWAMVFKGV